MSDNKLFRVLSDEEVRAISALIHTKLGDVSHLLKLQDGDGFANIPKFVECMQVLCILVGRLMVDHMLRVEKGQTLSTEEDLDGLQLSEFVQFALDQDNKNGWVEAAKDNADVENREIDPAEEYSDMCEECPTHPRCKVWKRHHEGHPENAPLHQGEEEHRLSPELEKLLKDLLGDK